VKALCHTLRIFPQNRSYFQVVLFSSGLIFKWSYFQLPSYLFDRVDVLSAVIVRSLGLIPARNNIFTLGVFYQRTKKEASKLRWARGGHAAPYFACQWARKAWARSAAKTHYKSRLYFSEDIGLFDNIGN